MNKTFVLRDEAGNQVKVVGHDAFPCADGVGTTFASRAAALAVASRVLVADPKVRLVVAVFDESKLAPVPLPYVNPIPDRLDLRKLKRRLRGG
jgi:hypothetical protein